MFGDGPVQPPAIPTAAAKAPPPVPVAAAATPSPAHAAPAAAAPAAAPVAAGGDLHAKLAGLGLTKDQVEGVLALTRDVIEKAVWEVVPQMAEMMIKEEIERLTKD